MKKSERGRPMHDTSSSIRNHLDDSPSHLLHRVLQIALDIYNAETGEGTVSQRQYAVLHALAGAEDQGPSGLSQTDLVRITGIDRSTLADLAARMAAKGLLARERSSADGRANLVRLTEAGRAALTETEPRVAAADAKILELLSPPKRDSFVKLLRKLVHARDGEASDVKADKAALKAQRKLEKAEKKRKKPDDRPRADRSRKKDKLTKKLKKLPMPGLSEGASDEAEERVHAPEDRSA